MIFNHAVKPLKHVNKKTHRIELINDWTIMITNYLMLLFTEIIADPVMRYTIGWVLVSVQGLTVAISLSLFLVEII
jgi:hypothetical protein